MLEWWENFHIKLLVSCWQKQKVEFGKGKAIKKVIFNRIASEFNSIFTDVKVIGEHCSRKWLKLEEDDNGPQQQHGSRQENMEIFHEWSLVSGGIQMYHQTSLWRAAAAPLRSWQTMTLRKEEKMKTNLSLLRALVQQKEKPLKVAVNDEKEKENQNLGLQRC